jgi:mRNA interferase RelE/StbE
MYEILFSKQSEKQLNKLEKTIQKQIINALERIRIRPELFVTKLVGDPAYKLRVGKYRILMEIKKNKLIILILKIGHRKKIYQK